VRELRNYLESSLVLEGSAADGRPAPPDAALLPLPEARRRAMDAFERHYLVELMALHGGRVVAAAETAGVARVYIYRLLARHGLKPGES